MNKEDIIYMAKQAGFERLGHDEHDYVCYLDDIVAFATLVASAERERIKQANAPEIERINAYIKEALAQPERDYERGFIDGMQKQMQSSVDKAVNRMAQPEPWEQFYPDIGKPQIALDQKAENARELGLDYGWVGLTDKEIEKCLKGLPTQTIDVYARRIEAKLKEKNT